MSRSLTPEKALIFRITHVNNVRWILENGLHPQNSETRDPNFVTIGNQELIDKRRDRQVPIEPGGSLSDYVPFYFTPFSPMLLNIKTGYGGITRRANAEIAILVGSLNDLNDSQIRFVFTDRHAYLELAEFYASLDDLHHIDWQILRDRDFKRDESDPEKMERYQAEALVYNHLPANALRGLVCYT